MIEYKYNRSCWSSVFGDTAYRLIFRRFRIIIIVERKVAPTLLSHSSLTSSRCLVT